MSSPWGYPHYGSLRSLNDRGNPVRTSLQVRTLAALPDQTFWMTASQTLTSILPGSSTSRLVITPSSMTAA